jgi:hypothetical protein
MNEYGFYEIPKAQNHTFIVTEYSEWVCYLFGSKKNTGISYRPLKGQEPNWFVRWMMKVCFSCTWVKDQK